jgi:hypothetical protein
MRCNWVSALFASVLIAFAAGPTAARPPKPPAPVKAAPAEKVELTAAEQELVADAECGEFKTLSLAEAALIGSGVTDADKRKGYLTKLDLLENRARRAVAGSKTDSDKGARLLTFLHAPGGPMKKYEKDQTSLAVLLDTGSFNCTSSAVLYNLLALRLGPEARAVEVVGHSHVFSLLRDGDRGVDVETTSARGFNPKREANAPATRPENRREVSAAGLVAIIAANRCANFIDEKDYPGAVRAALCARALDRELPWAETNLRAALGDWCRALALGGKVEGALAVLEKNRDAIEPTVRRELTMGVYGERLKTLLKEGSHEGAARMYAEAARQHKDDPELAGHCRHQALACLDTWAKPHLKKKEWTKVVEIYERGDELLPDDPAVREKLSFYRMKLAP